MEKNEIWKPVVGFEGYYEVSSMGRIRSLDMFVNCKNGRRLRKGRVLKPGICSNGYYRVDLSKNGITNHYLVHRIVAEAFLKNKENLPQVNHRNEIKSDNRACNLEWVTQKQNLEYSNIIGKWINGCIKNRNWLKANNARKKPIIQYAKDGKFVAEYESVKDAEIKTGINHTHISSCCLGKRKSTGNYLWMYKDEK